MLTRRILLSLLAIALCLALPAVSWGIIIVGGHDGSQLEMQGDRLFIIVQKDGKRMPAKDGKYMTKGGAEIFVQGGRIIKITGRGGKSVKPGDERAFQALEGSP